MDDSQITELYWQRDESALRESAAKYGGYCRKIAENILQQAEDAEECVNDTWLRAWNRMPPDKPNRLAVFLGRITRNLAIDRYRQNRTQKYGGGQTALCLDELSECIGEAQPLEDRILLRDTLQRFLSQLAPRHREMFLLRYWYLMSIAEIAARYAISEGAAAMQLSRIRKKLKTCLKKEGIPI